MTDFSTDDTPASSSPTPFAPVSPRRDDVPAPRREEPSVLSGGSAPATPAEPASSAGPPSFAGAPNGGQRLATEVKGRIDIADEVVEKVAGLAAMEVEGVADLGGDIERALESVRERIGIGNKRGDQGIKAKVDGSEVSIDVTIMIEYGHVVMDVARQVKNNVAAQTNRMLGLRVVEVNVTVDDVKLLQEAKADEQEDEDLTS